MPELSVGRLRGKSVADDLDVTRLYSIISVFQRGHFIYVRCTFGWRRVILAAMVNHSISVEVVAVLHTMDGRSCSVGRAGLHEEQKYVDEDRAQRKDGSSGGLMR